MAGRVSYHLKGILLGACNCDWGCPCNFEAPPTRGLCEGGYVWRVKDGSYRKTSLSGINIAWIGRSPGPVHEGNLTAILYVDERATGKQREVLEDLLTKNQEAIPFGIFMSLTSTFLGVHYVPFEINLDGMESRVKIPGIYELQLTPMKNPVTGEVEPATLLKPKGFTSKQQELCSTSALRFTSQGLTFEHSGKYGEFSPFEYQAS